jgi:hypothetical protein
VEQTGGDTLRHAIFPNSPRAVPTDPSDPAFVSRLDIEVTGERIPSPIAQSVDLTAAQQETGIAVNLTVPTGQQRRITVQAFNLAGTRIFSGETTIDLLGATVTVSMALHRVPELIPEAVTPSDLASKAFAFADGVAFGLSEEITLIFGTFTDNTGPFTLATASQTARGTVTVLPPVSTNAVRQTHPAGTPRQGETSTSCNFTIETGSFPPEGGPQTGQILLMQPCEVDALDGNLTLVNAATGLRSTSAPPTDAPEGPEEPEPVPLTRVVLQIVIPARVVPTDPNDPAFVSHIAVRVEAEGSPPFVSEANLTPAQQTGLTMAFTVPGGQNRHIMVDAFHVDPITAHDDLIFQGMTTTDLLAATQTVVIELSRVPLPAAVTPSALANRVFVFADGAAFGITREATLQFGTFTDNSGPFTLTSAGQTATGNVTILPPTSIDTLRRISPIGTSRQGETSTSCHFTIETSSFLSGSGPQGRQILRMHPCETDVLDGNLILVNADTDAHSTSAPPTPVGNAAPDGTIDTPAGAVTITAGETVTFTATCGDPDSTTPVSAAWNFGGGAATVLIEDPEPVRFDTPGIFTVTLTCTDALGASDPTPAIRTVTVLGPEVPEPIPPNTLRIGSPSVPVTHAQTFPVAVEFNSSTTNVISYLIELKFNPAVVVVTEITKGSAVFDEPITNPAAFSTGSVRFAANNPNFSPVSGQVILANITFQVVGNAGDTSELTLDFPATPGGNGVIASDTFEPITITSIIPGTVAVQ